jgi:hypothetical protein
MTIDRSAWSGDGDFTRRVIDALEGFEEVAYLRVEDAPASRAGSGFNLVANEIYVAFVADPPSAGRRRAGVPPARRPVSTPALTLAGLESRLAEAEGVGPADYSDDGMLQYLRTERIVAPYQTRGYKLVELVRIYELPGRVR